jgi:hypothetical protein
MGGTAPEAGALGTRIQWVKTRTELVLQLIMEPGLRKGMSHSISLWLDLRVKT